MPETALHNRTCVPCRGGVPPMERPRADEMLRELDGGWAIGGDSHLQLEKTYRFADFAEALAYVNRVGALAEEQNHHPDVLLTWGRVTLTIWTHKIKGLTESDFIFAAKCDRA